MNFKAIFKGFLLSFVLVILSLFVGALLVYFNILSEKIVSVVVFCAAAIGVFIGAFGVARTSEEKLLLNSLSVSLMFCVIVFIISVAINGGVVMHTRTLTLMGGAFAAAFLGALFGK